MTIIASFLFLRMLSRSEELQLNVPHSQWFEPRLGATVEVNVGEGSWEAQEDHGSMRKQKGGEGKGGEGRGG